MTDLPLKDLRVLVAEDSHLIAHDIQTILTRSGGTVLGPVSTIEAALDYVRTEAFDVALVDMELRERFADEVLEELERRSIPYVIVTAYLALPISFARAHGVILKPVSEAKLLDLLCDIGRSG